MTYLYEKSEIMKEAVSCVAILTTLSAESPLTLSLIYYLIMFTIHFQRE